MSDDFWDREISDPVDDHIEPLSYSEVKKYKHITSSGSMRWTKGEIIFMIIFGVCLIGLVVFSIIRDAPSP